jgi:hypothetical protein
MKKDAKVNVHNIRAIYLIINNYFFKYKIFFEMKMTNIPGITQFCNTNNGFRLINIL